MKYKITNYFYNCNTNKPKYIILFNIIPPNRKNNGNGGRQDEEKQKYLLTTWQRLTDKDCATVKPAEVTNIIRNNLSTKKAASNDLITAETLKESRKTA